MAKFQHQILIKLSDEDRRQIYAAAEQEDLAVATWVRRILRQWLRANANKFDAGEPQQPVTRPAA